MNINENASGTADMENIWAGARRFLAESLSRGSYKTWIEPLKASADKGGGLTLKGPNSFFANWVKTHFFAEISAALASVGFCPGSLEFAADFEAAPSSPISPDLMERPAPDPQGSLIPLRAARPMRNNGRYTFENFVVGDSNIYAFSAARALSAGAALGADSLFITSDHGLGKSHLSLAMGRAFLENKPRDNVYYLTAEDFTNEMTHSIRHGSMDDFKDKYRKKCDVLVLEEIQFLAGKEKIQSELCFTLDCLMERGRKVLLTSPQEPKDIPRLGRSLRSRLSTALLSPIGPPEYTTRLSILLKKAKSINLKTPRGLLEYAAERIEGDVRQLESCLLSLSAKSRLLGRQVDMDMAREALNHLFCGGEEDGCLSPLGVRALICRHFHLEAGEIRSKDRSARVKPARDIGMYLSRQHTRGSLGEIGAAFGRTHSSALYAINKLEAQLKKDAKLKGTIEFLTQRLFQAGP